MRDREVLQISEGEDNSIFHHKLSTRNHIQGINNLKLFLNLFTIYYQAARTGR
jgi:hypothetical protein